MAAVTVVLNNGLENTTTEAIAIEAGVSTRTFFNYYCNKHAAILGEAVCIDVTEAGWFVESQVPVTDDLATLLGQRLQDDPLDRNVLRKIIAVIDSTPALRDMFRTRLDETSISISTLLQARLGADFAIESRLLAELSTRAMTEAVMMWATEEAMTIDAVVAQISSSLSSVGKILCAEIGVEKCT